MTSRKRITATLIGLVALVVIGWVVKESGSAPSSSPSSSQPPSAGRSHSSSMSSMSSSTLTSLPEQAQQTWRLIEHGGPFPYPRNDGVVFGNRERLLPAKPRGFYHEYTVPTPGSRDRGARRIVTGDGKKLVYYTGDHYRSFVTVDVNR